jgi:hypothetical protein
MDFRGTYPNWSNHITGLVWMAKIIHLVSDQGNGVPICSNCKEDLYYYLNVEKRAGVYCPYCGEDFDGEELSPYNFGGSDF